MEKDDAEQWYRSIKVSSMGLPNQGTVHSYLQGNCENILITESVRIFPSTQLTQIWITNSIFQTIKQSKMVKTAKEGFDRVLADEEGTFAFIHEASQVLEIDQIGPLLWRE